MLIWICFFVFNIGNMYFGTCAVYFGLGRERVGPSQCFVLRLRTHLLRHPFYESCSPCEQIRFCRNKILISGTNCRGNHKIAAAAAAMQSDNAGASGSESIALGHYRGTLMDYIPCHLGLKRLNPSGWQIRGQTAAICLPKEKHTHTHTEGNQHCKQ